MPEWTFQLLLKILRRLPATLGIESKCQALNSKGVCDLPASHLLRTSTTRPRQPLSPSTSPNVRPLPLMVPGPPSRHRYSILISGSRWNVISSERRSQTTKSEVTWESPSSTALCIHALRSRNWCCFACSKIKAPREQKLCLSYSPLYPWSPKKQLLFSRL